MMVLHKNSGNDDDGDGGDGDGDGAAQVLTPPKCPLSYSFATIAHFTSVNVLKCAADSYSSTLHSMKLNWFVFLLHFPASQWLGSF